MNPHDRPPYSLEPSTPQATTTVDDTFLQAFAHHSAGHLAEAEALYRRILAVDSRHFDSLHLLGVIAQQNGRHEMALNLIGQALAVSPGNPDAHCNLGNVYKSLGRVEDAVASFRRALSINPTLAEAHNNLGFVLQERGQLDEAAASYKAALTSKPDYVEAHFNLANTFAALGRHDDALAAFERTLAIRPDYAEAHNNSGLVFHALARLDEARASFVRAIEIKPELVEAHNNLGMALRDVGRLDEASSNYRRALDLKPDFAEVHHNMGMVLRDRGRPEEAKASFLRALAIAPDRGMTHNNLGLTLASLGEFAAARAHYEKAFVLSTTRNLKPVEQMAWSNLIFTADCDPDASDHAMKEVRDSWARTIRNDAQLRPPVFANVPDTDRKLRIGYVSGDFRDHSAAVAFEPVIRSHDREKFSIFLYSNLAVEDSHTARFRSYADCFRSVLPLTDEALLGQIRSDGIDILVDLSGHSAGTRLSVFAQKAAPIQVTGWGYISGTGLPEIDYLFGDPVAVPYDARQYFAERIWDLPCILPFRPPAYDLKPNRPPACDKGYVTFGCFNRLIKLWPALPLFARLLREMPTARLILKTGGLGEPATGARVMRVFDEHGAPRDRIELRGPSAAYDHLTAFHDIDIALDSFPQTGGVTTLESLWLGVPVVTLCGASVPARISSALLTTLGLTHLIATTHTGYVEIAKKVAADLEALSGFRVSMRAALLDSVICDARKYTAHVEQAYGAMWRHWCSKSQD